MGIEAVMGCIVRSEDKCIRMKNSEWVSEKGFQ